MKSSSAESVGGAGAVVVRFALVAGMLVGLAAQASAQQTLLVLDRPQVAGVAGFRALWDVPIVLDENGPTEIRDDKIKDRHGTAIWSPAKRAGGSTPGAIVFDALQRFVLVRFPDAAERIAAELSKGLTVRRVELVLPYRDTELWPPGDPNWAPPDGYLYRMNWGVDRLYRARQPRWHAVAHALRRPWLADADIGPTFNAFINGAAYWSRWGASDTEKDRFPMQFGPTEVSAENPEGRMDVTAVLSDAAFGADLPSRLRTLADCGFILSKWETYDHLYYTGCYEWATATGGRGILLRTPKLVVTLVPSGAGAALSLPAAADVRALAAKLKGTPAGGRPTAVLPSAEELKKLADRYAARPRWMSDWQWQRVIELMAIDPSESAGAPFWYQYVPRYMRERQRPKGRGAERPEAPPEVIYCLWVDSLIGRQPRGWSGFEAAKEMTQWYRYREALPGPARDAIVRYWTAWLMPDRPTSELVHPMKDALEARAKGLPDPDEDSYYRQTGDWRGNKSFYRAGFNYTISTQNFNTSAASGALLGGAIIGSAYAMADGRHGLEHYPLRLWTWSSGSTQEYVDHYYYAITLCGYKTVVDFGPTMFDRLMGVSMLSRGLEELTSCYHPGLRRFIAGASRTSLEYLLVTQDGLQHIMHVMSRKGALHDLDNSDVPGKMSVLGHERNPNEIAQQTMCGPWAPEWTAAMVDDKPLPYEHTSRYQNGFRRSYLGRNFGLASSDRIAGRFQIMAQWRRKPETVARMQDIVTMDLRYGFNTTSFANSAPGWIYQPGTCSAIQHRNRMLVVSSPAARPGGLAGIGNRDDIRSLQTSIVLFNYEQPRPSWEIYVDGQRVERLPFAARQGQRITIRDGQTYFGAIALPATDLGRSAEVVLEEGTEQQFGRCAYRPALVINSYNLLREKPLGDGDDWTRIDKAFGGFAVELADASDYAGFAAFQEHMSRAQVEVKWDDEAGAVRATYRSGGDVIEGVCPTESHKKEGGGYFSECRINGAAAFLPEGVDRDTTLTQQTRTGRVEKGGAVLLCEPGRTGYLQIEPASGTYAGFNPLPDLTTWSLAVPGGITVRADGRIGLARVVVRPKENRFWIDHAFRDGQAREASAAKSMLIFGCRETPTFEVNGRPLERGPTRLKTADGDAWAVPLGEG